MTVNMTVDVLTADKLMVMIVVDKMTIDEMSADKIPAAYLWLKFQQLTLSVFCPNFDALK